MLQQELAQHLLAFKDQIGLSYRQLAQTLGKKYCPGSDHSRIWRCLRGKELPSEPLLKHLHEMAVAEAGPDVIRITLIELQDLLERAKQFRKIDRLTAKLAGLPAHVDHVPAMSAHLPVPQRMSDRQHNVKNLPQARHLADRVRTLLERNQMPAVLAALQESSEILSPSELAATISLLHDVDDEIAKACLRMLGRDQPARSVLRIAYELSRLGQIKDVFELLEVASQSEIDSDHV